MAGQFINLTELMKLGWEDTGVSFGGAQIWKKGNSRLLYLSNFGKVSAVITEI